MVSVLDRDGIRTITLDRPPRNLLDPEVMGALADALRAADADDGVAGIALTGAGEAFCGGLDIQAIQAGADPVAFAAALVDLLRLLDRLATPVAAAVNGDAVASGASLAVACDYAAMVPDARLGTFEVSVGIWPMVAQVPLIHRIGPRLAMENVGSGEPFTAERAREVGAVNAVVAPDRLGATVGAWLHAAARAGAAGRQGRPAFYELARLPYDAALGRALEDFAAMFRADG